MRKKMIAIALTLCLIDFANGQTLTQQQFMVRLDSFTNKLMERIPVIPAITITIVNGDGALFNKAYGWADKEAGMRADLNTEFYIASSTKSFTALAAALLDYDKKILLDDPVEKYFRHVQFKSELGNDVTIRSLLTHTSGLENGALTFRMAFSGTDNMNEMLKILGDATTVRAKPGSYKYDNLGYNIYALALQDHMNIKWQDLLQEKIFKPLGMKRTTAYMSTAKKNNWIVAQPYDAFGVNGLEKLYLSKNDNTMQSAGGLITTPSDIVLWLQAQINLGKIKTRQIFPDQVMKETQSGYASFQKGGGLFSAAGQYGLGWSISEYRNQKIIYHFGGFPGYRAHVSFMPDKKIGLAIFTNEGTVAGAAVDLLAGFVYDWVTGENIMDTYSKKADELEVMYKKAVEGTQRSIAERAKRTWQLSMPLQTYTGKYSHPYFGEMDVAIENNALSVRMGNLHAVSTPFTETESIRVELIPGTGQVVRFKKDDESKVNSLMYDGQEYRRK